jgi:hypothetical protein
MDRGLELRRLVHPGRHIELVDDIVNDLVFRAALSWINADHAAQGVGAVHAHGAPESINEMRAALDDVVLRGAIRDDSLILWAASTRLAATEWCSS